MTSPVCKVTEGFSGILVSKATTLLFNLSFIYGDAIENSIPYRSARCKWEIRRRACRALCEKKIVHAAQTTVRRERGQVYLLNATCQQPLQCCLHDASLVSLGYMLVV